MVLLLAAQPAIATMAHEEKTECCGGCCPGEEDKQASDLPLQSNCSDNCNPFLSCCSCLNCAINLPIPSFLVPVVKGALLPAFEEQVSDPFHPDCWHPPRMG